MGIDSQETNEQGRNAGKRKAAEVAENVVEVTAEKAPAKPREVETVTMTDGRKVDFAGKRKMIKDTFVEDGKASVRFDFRNGETRTFHVHPDHMAQHAAHGAAQKIGDETAGENDVDDMVIAVDAMIDRLNKGEWHARRASAGDSFSGASVVIKALCEVTGKSPEEIKTFLDGKLAATEGLTRRALYSSFRNPASKTGQVIARLELEKNSKSEKLHAEDLLAELGA
jgi:hypothetical protein